MRRKLFNLACLVVAISGCAAESADGIRKGTPITHVQADHGLPDVICDTSGDQARYYVPTDRPKDEWPADAPRTFYYLKQDLAVTFVLGKATNVAPIEAELRSAVLLPLVAAGTRQCALLS
jgi:hypothetical protein